MNLEAVLFGTVTFVYSLIILLPRFRRELTAAETGTCLFIVSVSGLVLTITLIQDTHPQIAGLLGLVEVGLVVVVIGWWMLKLAIRVLRPN